MLDEIKYTKGRIEAKLNVLTFQEDDVWIAWIPSLNISSYGDSNKEAIENVKEATELLFEHIVKKHTVIDVLKELGWSLKPRTKRKFQITPDTSKYPEYQPYLENIKQQNQLMLSY